MNIKIILFVVGLIILNISGFLVYAKFKLGWFKSSESGNTTGKWVEFNKTSCSATECGTSGTTTSTFKCQIDDKIIDDIYCPQAQPNSVNSCNAPSCGMWDTQPFPNCFPHTCGYGKKYKQTRDVKCIDRESKEPIEDNKCYAKEKPPIEHECLDQSPCSWKAGGWYATGGTPPTEDNFVLCNNENDDCSKV